MRWVVGAACAAALLLSGCTSGPTGCMPPASARDGGGTLHAGGPGDFEVQIEVADALGGTPLPGADVLVLWNRDAIDEDDGPPRQPPLVAMRLVTDAEGRAVAWLHEDRYYLVDAAMPGWTEEWTEMREPVGRRGAAVRLELYPETLALESDDSYPGPVTAPDAFGNPSWKPVEFRMAPVARMAGVRDRMVHLEASLAWNSTQTELADLRLGLGPSEHELRDGAAEPWDAAPSAGPHRVEWRADRSGGGQDWPGAAVLGPTGLWVGPAVQRGLVSLDGVDYRLEATARLDRRASLSCGVLLEGSSIEPYGPGGAAGGAGGATPGATAAERARSGPSGPEGPAVSGPLLLSGAIAALSGILFVAQRGRRA